MSMLSHANVMTVGQVAKICGCSPRMVSYWVDKGVLKGYRLPESRDRRVAKADLMVFLKERGMTAQLETLKDEDESGAVLADYERALHGEGPLLRQWQEAPDLFAMRLINRCKRLEGLS